jgi:hypothetical protein
MKELESTELRLHFLVENLDVLRSKQEAAGLARQVQERGFLAIRDHLQYIPEQRPTPIANGSDMVPTPSHAVSALRVTPRVYAYALDEGGGAYSFMLGFLCRTTIDPPLAKALADYARSHYAAFAERGTVTFQKAEMVTKWRVSEIEPIAI